MSYSERRRTLRSPVKLSLWMQLMRLFLSILEGRQRMGRSPFYKLPLESQRSLTAFSTLLLLLRADNPPLPLSPIFPTPVRSTTPVRPTYRVRSPSRPRNMALRTDSSWLTVRCSSLTEAAPSKAPSSISDTLLLLRFLGKQGT